MANLREPLCSWDTTIDERYNLYTTGNTEEVLPGITRPLPADLIRAWNYAWHTNATSQLQIEDLVPIPEPPGPTMLPIVAGQFLVNIGMVNAFTSTFETGGSADYLKQFFEGDEEITAEVSEDTSRAEEVQERLMAFLVRTRELIEADAERARAHYAASLARDWTAVDDAGLLAAVEETTAHNGDVFFTHYLATSGGALQTTLLGGLLDAHVPDHPAEWTAGLTSGLTGVESARPSKAIWDLSRFVAARPALATEVAGISADGFQARLASPPDGDWAAFAGEYESFIADLGFRGQRETDPSCLTWNEAPQFVLSSLQADLAAGDDRNPHVLEERSAAQRVALEAEVEAALPEDQHAEFRRLLELSQILNGGRESTKANWTRFCRTYRPPIVEMGRRLAARGDIDNPEDVWFLRLEELPEALDGGLPRPSCRTPSSSVATSTRPCTTTCCRSSSSAPWRPPGGRRPRPPARPPSRASASARARPADAPASSSAPMPAPRPRCSPARSSSRPSPTPPGPPSSSPPPASSSRRAVCSATPPPSRASTASPPSPASAARRRSFPTARCSASTAPPAP